MQVVSVIIDQDARDAYLAVYKQRGVDRVNAHLKAVWEGNYARNAFLEMVYQHRAMQGFAYLNDPNRDANIARYPLVETGIPSYGATRAEVAESYIVYSNQMSADIASLYEDWRHAVNETIPAQPDKPQVDTLVAAFISSHPIWT